MSEITSIYADFIKETSYETPSLETISQAKKYIFDVGIPEATIIGQKNRRFTIPAAIAATEVPHTSLQ